jgi:hypothetical protein
LKPSAHKQKEQIKSHRHFLKLSENVPLNIAGELWVGKVDRTRKKKNKAPSLSYHSVVCRSGAVRKDIKKVCKTCVIRATAVPFLLEHRDIKTRELERITECLINNPILKISQGEK